MEEVHPLDPQLTKEQESMVRLGHKRYCMNDQEELDKHETQWCERELELWATKPITINDGDNPAPVYLSCSMHGIVRWYDSSARRST